MSTQKSGIKDPIGLANKRPKGKRPHFFDDKNVERVMSITMAVAMEHAVTHQRLDALERLIERKGLLSREELEHFQPTREEEAARTLWIQEYIARILRLLQQEAEAMKGGGETESMEDVQQELRQK